MHVYPIILISTLSIVTLLSFTNRQHIAMHITTYNYYNFLLFRTEVSLTIQKEANYLNSFQPLCILAA